MPVVGFLATNETRGKVTAMAADHFDLVIVAGSWEQRCRNILDWQSLSADDGLLFQFAGTPGDDPVKTSDKRKNIQALLERLGPRIAGLTPLLLPRSTQMGAIFPEVGDAMMRAAILRGRRLKILVDISSMPRSLISYILLSSFKRKIADRLSFFFSISDHTESVKMIAQDGLAGRAPYVEGKWDLMSVPYGEGRITGGRFDNIVVSVGLDTFQIMDVIERIEPQSAILLVPQRGDEQQFDVVATKQVEALQRRFKHEFDSGRYIANKVPPYDLSWLPSLSRSLKGRIQTRDNSILFYPFGPKIHSVGLSLLALQRDDIAVIGRTPAAYFKRRIDATGEAVIVSMTDLSSITSRGVVQELQHA